METWNPVSFEDHLLYKYWVNTEGHLFLEVPLGNKSLGNWPEGSRIRRIDGVILKKNQSFKDYKVYKRKDFTLNEFLNYAHNSEVELIEVKKKLNRLVIGQVIVGVDMFERQYGITKIKPVILCQIGDPALEWVCEKRGISVYYINHNS